MELEREFIEGKTFESARRGYDRDEVDRHLHEVAVAVAQFKEQARVNNESLGGAAASQVRSVLEAAEKSASELREEAEREANETRDTARREAARTTDSAAERARQIYETAEGQVAERLQSVQDETSRMLERAGSVEQEIGRLIEGLSEAVSLMENLRDGARSLKGELEQTESNLSGLREARAQQSANGGTSSDGQASSDGEQSWRDSGNDAKVVSSEAQRFHERRGAEGARLIALNMALNGTPRDETEQYLADNFNLDDHQAILDEVYRSAHQ
jgi:DivIVA domain-containing protein